MELKESPHNLECGDEYQQASARFTETHQLKTLVEQSVDSQLRRVRPFLAGC